MSSGLLCKAQTNWAQGDGALSLLYIHLLPKATNVAHWGSQPTNGNTSQWVMGLWYINSKFKIFKSKSKADNFFDGIIHCKLVYDQNLVSVSATETKIKSRYRFRCQNFFCLNLNFPPFFLRDKEQPLDSQDDTNI